MPKVTLAMLALLDTEEKITRCIEALQSVGRVPDEVLLVMDDRSDEQAPNKIVHALGAWEGWRFVWRAWTGDFSEARNFAQRKAKHNWILLLDADDHYENGGGLQEILSRVDQVPGGYTAVVGPKKNVNPHTGDVLETEEATLYAYDRRHFTWEGRRHNQLVQAEGAEKGARLKLTPADGVTLVGNYHPEGLRKRLRAAVVDLLQEAATHRTARSYFLLARSYAGLGEWGEVMRWTTRLFEEPCFDLSTGVPRSSSRNKTNPEFSQAWALAARASFEVHGTTTLIEKIIQEGLEYHPREPDLLHFAGYLMVSRYLEATDPEVPNPLREFPHYSPAQRDWFLKMTAEVGWGR